LTKKLNRDWKIEAKYLLFEYKNSFYQKLKSLRIKIEHKYK